jgi:hypothetical protein
MPDSTHATFDSGNVTMPDFPDYPPRNIRHEWNRDPAGRSHRAHRPLRSKGHPSGELYRPGRAGPIGSSRCAQSAQTQRARRSLAARTLSTACSKVFGPAWVSRRVLDGTSCQTGFRWQANGGSALIRRAPEAILKVCRNRKVRRFDDGPGILENVPASQTAAHVPPPEGKSQACTRRG